MKIYKIMNFIINSFFFIMGFVHCIYLFTRIRIRIKLISSVLHEK